MTTPAEFVRLLIVGAGGHAQVVANTILQMRQCGEAVEPIGFVDDNPLLVGQQILGLPILGATSDIGKLAHDAVVVGVGNNAARQQLFKRMREGGERLFTVRHPRSVVAPDAVVGAGTVVCAGAVVVTGAVVGANVILNTSCSINHHSRIGDHVHIAPGAHLGGEVTVGEGVFVGIGSIVLPRKRISDWSVVRAGSVVSDDVAGGLTVTDVPGQTVEAKVEIPMAGVRPGRFRQQSPTP
jgi:sugar O-acyltransferase (sialic acid O-acetyltransferase NeuD family)